MEHNMHDMGEMRNMPTAVEDTKSPKEKHYPTTSISSKQMPELKGKKFGDKVEMHIKGEVGGMHEDYDDKEEAIYEIKMIECEMIGKGMPKKEYDQLSDEEKDKADEEDVMGGKE